MSRSGLSDKPAPFDTRDVVDSQDYRRFLPRFGAFLAWRTVSYRLVSDASLDRTGKASDAVHAAFGRGPSAHGLAAILQRRSPSIPETPHSNETSNLRH